MKDKLIIVNHIGTSVLSAIETELKPLVREIEDKIGCETILSFSSKRAINKLADQSIKIDYFYDLIKKVNHNKRAISVLPTHIVGGSDYQNMCESINNLSNKQDLRVSHHNIKLIKPLLRKEGNVPRLVGAINDLVADKDKHIIFIGHGTSNESNMWYDKFIHTYKRTFAKISFLSLDSSLDSIIKLTPKEVVIFPLFAVNGYHMHKDIFRGNNSVLNQLLQAGKIVKSFNNGLLSYSDIRNIYIDSLTH